MSDSIRMVGANPGVSGGSDVGSTDGGAFRTSLEAARETTGPSEASAGRGVGALHALSEGLAAGTLAPSAVVERLVERALAAPGARGLTEAGRAQLEQSLRTALAEDPTLLAMQAELSAGAKRP
ncbi:MAG: hypothetical protein ACK6CU_08070 [Deltaproteobacteria bacterium]